MEAKTNQPQEDNVIKKKRGRKPKPKEDKIYFGEREENAVLDYLKAETQVEKNTIFKNYLEKPFKKMVEAIIRGYDKYFPDEDFIDTYCDALSDLITKLDKYKPEKGTKAYSYYSNVCKNYLSGRILAHNKMLIRNPSYDTLDFDVSNDIKYISYSDKDKKYAKQTIELLTTKIKSMLDDDKMKEEEAKIGNALINLFENWDYVLTTDASQKLNKSAILLFLKEQTGLDTKGIRDNMKKYKKEFMIIKEQVIS